MMWYYVNKLANLLKTPSSPYKFGIAAQNKNGEFTKFAKSTENLPNLVFAPILLANQQNTYYMTSLVNEPTFSQLWAVGSLDDECGKFPPHGLSLRGGVEL